MGRYYSPLVVCPLQRGRHRRGGRRLAWKPPGPGNPNRERGTWLQFTSGRLRLIVVVVEVKNVRLYIKPLFPEGEERGTIQTVWDITKMQMTPSDVGRPHLPR